MLGFVSTPPSRVSDEGTVNALSRNTVTRIESIDGPKPFQDRLKAIGLSVGSQVKVLRTGCPVVLHSEGGRFCLRKEDASRIRVTPVFVEVSA